MRVEIIITASLTSVFRVNTGANSHPSRNMTIHIQIKEKRLKAHKNALIKNMVLTLYLFQVSKHLLLLYISLRPVYKRQDLFSGRIQDSGRYCTLKDSMYGFLWLLLLVSSWSPLGQIAHPLGLVYTSGVILQKRPLAPRVNFTLETISWSVRCDSFTCCNSRSRRIFSLRSCKFKTP